MSSRNVISNRLALGTVQLGQRYGIANRTGQPDEVLARSILELAWLHGVRYFDTAQAYGRSEAIIGGFVHDRPEVAAAGMRIVTKVFPRIPPADVHEIESDVERSFVRLGGLRIWAVLLHGETLLDKWEYPLGPALRACQTRGLVEHLGVSVQTEDGMKRAIEALDLDVIQAPASALDRRMSRAGLFTEAALAGKTVFVRSVFLQGLMLLDPEIGSRLVPSASGALACLHSFCREQGIDRRRFAIGYARHRAPEARLVIGAETPQQVEDNCQLVSEEPEDTEHYSEWDAAWPDDDPSVVDPSTWPLTDAR